MKPFSDNVIFLDTEFSSLDPNKGEILSIGLVRLGGEELYLELEHEGEVDEWVKENILPTLKAQKVSREEAVKKVREFVGDKRPHIIGYINQDDVVYWQKLYRSVGVKDNLFNLVSIDFASMLFMSGIDPMSYYCDDEGFYKKIGIDYKKYKKHHALDDAKLLREVYLKFIKA